MTIPAPGRRAKYFFGEILGWMFDRIELASIASASSRSRLGVVIAPVHYAAAFAQDIRWAKACLAVWRDVGVALRLGNGRFVFPNHQWKLLSAGRFEPHVETREEFNELMIEFFRIRARMKLEANMQPTAEAPS